MAAEDTYNTTFGTNENSEEFPEAFIPASKEQMIAITIIIAVLGLWSTFGNMLTILAITTQKNMLTKINVFILSLSISDLLSGVIASPLWLYRRTWGFYSWELGEFACKLTWFMDESTNYSTAMHIASFSIWRFILIKWPLRMSATKRRSIIIWMGVIWIIALIFGGFVPSQFFAPLDKTNTTFNFWPMCSVDFRNGGIAKGRSYYLVSSSLFMLLPFATLMIMSILIAIQLLCTKQIKSELRRIKENRAVIQLSMIATSFVVGYVPIISYMVLTSRGTNRDKIFDYWFGVLAHFCLRFSECMNPIAYNAASNKMRKASKDVLYRIWNCSGRKIVSANNSRVTGSTPNGNDSTNKI